MRIPRWKLVLVAAILVGCHGTTSPTEQHHPPIAIVAGNGVTDTVSAKLNQALVVEVAGNDGHLLPGTVVRFTALPAANGGAPTAYIASLTQGGYGTFVADSSDSRGRASVLVELGTVAGPARIEINVPEIGVSDTAQYTVQPGAAAQLRISIRDTAVMRGAQYTLAASSADRFGNARPNDAISFTSRSSVATVDAKGNVTAAQEGRGTILVQSGTAKDSSMVSVIPSGTLVIWGGGQIAVANTDGSQRKVLTTSSHEVVYPQWSPDGTKILFYEADPLSDAYISTVDMNGVRTRIIGPNSSLLAASYGRYTRDGSWIYFTARDSSGSYYVTWRVHPDGTQLAQVGPTSADGGSLRPDVSPDGSTVIYQAASEGFSAIGSMDIATHAIRSLGATGSFPTYSPDGSQIAFVAPMGQSGATEVFVMNADGTGVRQISPATQSYNPWGVSWSPDGQWLVVVNSSGGLEVLRVSDGLRLPLKLSGFQASWKH